MYRAGRNCPEKNNEDELCDIFLFIFMMLSLFKKLSIFY